MFLSDISGSCFPRKKGDFSLSVAQCRLSMCRKKTEEGSKERRKGGREGGKQEGVRKPSLESSAS